MLKCTEVVELILKITSVKISCVVAKIFRCKGPKLAKPISVGILGCMKILCLLVDLEIPFKISVT